MMVVTTWRFALAALLGAASAFPQGGFGNLFTKAPPDVDNALREKVTYFYDMHVQGKYRQADAVVHEDSKDVFFGAEKIKMRGFKIVSINYEEGFQRAKVVADIDTEFYFVGFGKMDVHRPVVSSWARDDKGQWWWTVEKTSARETPFGRMNPGPDGDPAKKIDGEDLGKLIEARGIKVADLKSRVKADKDSIELLSHKPSNGEVNILNDFDGPIEISMQADDFPGVVFALDQTKVEAGQKAKLTVHCRPVGTAKKPDLRALLIIEPLGKTIPIKVTFAYPPFDEPKPGPAPAPAK